MILGILSDTHHRADAMRAGITALQAAGAEFFIHCGDVGDESVIDQLAGLPNAIVWGNNDFDRSRLADYAASVGVNVHHPAARITLAGKAIVVTHGDDSRLLRSILLDNTADYLFFGHTHQTLDERHGRIRVINPGALFRASPKTVAVLNLQTNQLQFLEITV